MTEDPALLYIGEYEVVYDGPDFRPEFVESCRRCMADMGFDLKGVSATTVSSGYGADAMALLIGAGAVFLLGKKIDENIDAWARIGARVSALFRGPREDPCGLRMSLPLGVAALVHTILADSGQDRLTVENYGRLAVPNRSVPPELQDDFATSPERYYYLVARVPNGDAYMAWLRSNGTGLTCHRLALSNQAAFHADRFNADS